MATTTMQQEIRDVVQKGDWWPAGTFRAKRCICDVCNKSCSAGCFTIGDFDVCKACSAPWDISRLPQEDCVEDSSGGKPVTSAKDTSQINDEDDQLSHSSYYESYVRQDGHDTSTDDEWDDRVD
jgi:hypothetical protein